MNDSKNLNKKNKAKSDKKKLCYKNFKNKKQLENIDNNTSYYSSDDETITSNDEKSKGSSKNKKENLKKNDKNEKETIINNKDKENKINNNDKDKIIKNKDNNKIINNKDKEKEKENNTNISNKSNPAPFQGLVLNKMQSNLLPPNLKNDQLQLAKVNEQNINPNIINNNLVGAQALNNNLYPINNLNQLYLLNQNQLLNGNNNLLLINPNLNQQLVNNPNLAPRLTNIVPTIPLQNLMLLNAYNNQKIPIDGKQRQTTIPLANRYSLDNNLNVGNERLTNVNAYQLVNGERIIPQYQNALNPINNQYLPQQIINPNIMNPNNQILIQQQLLYKNPNIGQLIVNNPNINNKNILNPNINQQDNKVIIKTSGESLNSQMDNREIMGPRDNISKSRNINLQINDREDIGPRDNISKNNKVNLQIINREIIGPRDNISNNNKNLQTLNNRQIIVPNNNIINNNVINQQSVNNRLAIVSTNNYINNNVNQLNVVPDNNYINSNVNRLTIVPEHNFASVKPLNQVNDQYIINPSKNQQLNNLNNDNILNNQANQIMPQENQNDDLNQILFRLSNSNTFSDQSKNNYNANDYYSNLLTNYTQQTPTNNQVNDNILLRDFGFLSRPGSDDTGMTKTNQDSYFSKTNINGLINFNIFGVLDGHGPDGHFVSEFASEFIPNQIINNPEIRMNNNPEIIYNKLRQNNYQIIKNAFLLTDNKLKTTNFNARESGTTCVIIIHIGNHLICANVGDSRAIVAFDQNNDPNLQFLRVMPLSIDYKPELPEEKARILMSGGVVEQFQNNFGMYIGPYRVFAPGKDYPGLAMSRSIGDLEGKRLGIIAVPGIMEYTLNKNTKFIILCSDGVWEFLSNENVKNIGRQFYLNSNASELCQELISRSVIEWEKNDDTVDDITCVAIFF